MKKLTISKTLIAAALMSGLTFSQVSVANEQVDYKQSADNAPLFDSKKENTNRLVGVGSFALAGGSVGGPLGAAIGGVIGLFVGEEANNDYREKTLNAKLDDTKQTLSQTEADYLALQQEYQDTLIAFKQLQADQKRVQLVSMAKEVAPVDLADLMASKAHIQFKTASYQLEQHYVEQLDIVADQLKSDPKLVVQLFGYADRRGEENYNQTLSEKRAEQVERYLISKGVNKTQIETAGYGEAQPVTVKQTWENDFFDRRVVVRLTTEDAVMTAKQ